MLEILEISWSYGTCCSQRPPNDEVHSNAEVHFAHLKIDLETKVNFCYVLISSMVPEVLFVTRCRGRPQPMLGLTTADAGDGDDDADVDAQQCCSPEARATSDWGPSDDARRTGAPAPGMRARDTAALPLNQIVCGHAATVMASWPSRSIDLIITSPPYWDAVIYDGEMPPWPWLDTPPDGVRLPTMPGGEGMIVLKKHETRQALVVATVLD